MNLGDSYIGGKGQSGARDATFQEKRFKDGKSLEHGYHQASGGYGKTRPTDRKQQGAKQKSLAQIPERFSLMMTDELGWIKRNTIVWKKRNCMPSSAKDRFTVDFEYVYFFTKQGKYWFKQQFEDYAPASEVRYRQALRANRSYNTKELVTELPSFPYKRGIGSVKSRGNDPDGLVVGGTNNSGRNKRCVWQYDMDKLLREALKDVADGFSSIDTALLRIHALCEETAVTTWDIPTQPSSESYFAMFPQTLVEPMLDAGCPPGGIVLDPFAGMCTMASVAIKQGKKFIMFELSKDYADRSRKRINAEMMQTKLDL